MKIEKISENQIRCTLTSSDLESRKIRLSELAYGSDKARLLFQDMMQQAHRNFGFESDNSPLMIEAIPLSHDSIVLIITKVEDPEELDTRFSRFSTPDPEPGDHIERHFTGADEILDLFRRISGKQEEDTAGETEAASEPAKGKTTKDSPHTSDITASVNLIQAYRFRSFADLIRAAHILGSLSTCSNTLVKDPSDGCCCLVLHADQTEPELFNKICNILTEYGNSFVMTPGSEAHLLEHGDVLIKDHALQSLKQL